MTFDEKAGFYEDLEPEVGMGLTLFLGSDRYAGTIMKVTASKKTFWFTRDVSNPTPDSDFYDEQKYTYKPNPNEWLVKVVHERKGNNWKTPGNGYLVVIGKRDEYRDPSF
jgi:hypothetical protein